MTRDVTRDVSWGRVVRLGLVQLAIGAVAALLTSVLNRVMVVELGLPATVPSALVAMHFAVQMLRAPMGHASDLGGRRRWIFGGAVGLAAGATLAAFGLSVAVADRAPGLALAAVGVALIGLGMSASGTALLAEIADVVAPERLGRAAALLWVMMLVGIVATAGGAGAVLDPFTFRQLVHVCAAVGVIGLVFAAVAATGARAVPKATPSGARIGVPHAPVAGAPEPSFREAVQAVWSDPTTRGFATFVFAAMLAFSMQDLILEPYAGIVFNLSPGASTRLGGTQHAGVLVGLVGAALLSARVGTLRAWAVGGCAASGLALFALATTPASGSLAVLRVAVFALGLANGAFAVGALGAMMAITAGDRAADGSSRAGLRVGVFGAAQAIAYGLGGLLGGVLSDVARAASGSAARGYGVVFMIEGVLFIAAAWMAARSTPDVGPSSRGVAQSDAHGAALLAAIR